MRNSRWLRLLAYVTGSVNQELLRNDYLAAENRILRAKLRAANGEPGSEKRVVITGLFDFFDVSAKELAQRARLRYGLPRKLAPIPQPTEEEIRNAHRVLNIVFVPARDGRRAPARSLIGEMMHYFEDVDGNFIQQFQSDGFDARLWELSSCIPC